MVLLQFCAITTSIQFQNIFINSKKTLCPVNNYSSLSPAPSSWQPSICILSLWIYLLWTFHVNTVIEYVTFCVWFLLLSIKFSFMLSSPRLYFESVLFSFIWLNNIPLYGYAFHSLLIKQLRNQNFLILRG